MHIFMHEHHVKSRSTYAFAFITFVIKSDIVRVCQTK